MDKIEKIERFLERIGMQWTYVLWSPNYPYKGKAGWSGRMKSRRAEIEQSMREETGRDIRVWLFFKMPMFWAHKAEKAIHNSALWRRASGMPGSGCTEWAHVLNVYSFIITYILLWGFDLPLHFSLVALFIPLPLDFAVFVFVIALAQYAFVGLLTYGVWNLMF